jgi:hypothetical protein
MQQWLCAHYTDFLWYYLRCVGHNKEKKHRDSKPLTGVPDRTCEWDQNQIAQVTLEQT